MMTDEKGRLICPPPKIQDDGPAPEALAQAMRMLGITVIQTCYSCCSMWVNRNDIRCLACGSDLMHTTRDDERLN